MNFTEVYVSLKIQSKEEEGKKKYKITLKKFTGYNLTCLFALYFPTVRKKERKNNLHPTKKTSF